MAAVAAGAKDEEGAMGDVFYTYTTSTKRRAWRVEVIHPRQEVTENSNVGRLLMGLGKWRSLPSRDSRPL